MTLSREDMSPKSPFDLLSYDTQKALKRAAKQGAVTLTKEQKEEIDRDWIMVPIKKGMQCQVAIEKFRAYRF